jgi:hypothetical protein
MRNYVHLEKAFGGSIKFFYAVSHERAQHVLLLSCGILFETLL